MGGAHRRWGIRRRKGKYRVKMEGTKGKKIVLGVCGGIAAYKSVELLRLMKKEGAEVRVIMTRHALEFVGSLTFQTLSGEPVCTDLFEPHTDASIRHIEWAQEADAVVVVPATANMIGKLSHGIADDALSTFMLAVTAPVCICPSMNSDMYLSPPVQRNLSTLVQDGYLIVEPGSGELACGTTGPGRLAQPEFILDRLHCCLSSKDLEGRTIHVTAGPTQEPIDPVRYISNPSSGKMGFALARAAEYRGAKVKLISGPTALTDPIGVETTKVQTAKEMYDAVMAHLDEADIVIKTAAVSDYSPREQKTHKIKKDHEEMVLHLKKNPDILKTVGIHKDHQILVGFAAETGDLSENALHKLKEKNLDMIVANLIHGPDSGFQSDTNRVTLFFKDGSQEVLPKMEKNKLAHIILDRVVERISGHV
jgi:phosphopantothenoylcysteine decarboxylase/phosphopantothenate--cysteine ligase